MENGVWNLGEKRDKRPKNSSERERERERLVCPTPDRMSPGPSRRCIWDVSRKNNIRRRTIDNRRDRRYPHTTLFIRFFFFFYAWITNASVNEIDMIFKGKKPEIDYCKEKEKRMVKFHREFNKFYLLKYSYAVKSLNSRCSRSPKFCPLVLERTDFPCRWKWNVFSTLIVWVSIKTIRRCILMHNDEIFSFVFSIYKFENIKLI